ncbi:2Fe-2S iron-sulfur cluster-binding protein [Citricoccus nitrophenolicus]|uniref:2Fe-2S iron-sulfur cluster-binding protein n=1 Tax=Citricoccus nitrophenolicus TaxID=863575 RepID=A0ABV0IF01_9MICC|nr:2Fe-2S iron-sulfur cluster-binding protein [Citricoccus sp. I39-566]WMY76888.1 2Fe-2S iron-sulfur cluster-binding protein [Citricoccus sp. I39-566]
MEQTITLRIDGTEHEVPVDTRATLLDALRERVGNTSPKKGCDHGQCGSCTVLLDGRRHLTCLALAVAYDGAEVVTASGLAGEGQDGAEGGLHPVQQAFMAHDGFQCGYCTPGQVCSVVGMLQEAGQGHPSHVTGDLESEIDLDDDEIRERMSGNLCRCGAYVGILDAVREVAGR